MALPESGEEKLLGVIEKQRIAEDHGLRTKEFDKLVKYLDFYRLPTWEKIAIYGYRVVGVGLGLLLLLAII